jgi:signal transduction histidine kinase
MTPKTAATAGHPAPEAALAGCCRSDLQAVISWTGLFAVPSAFFIGLRRERLAFASVGNPVRGFENLYADSFEAALGETLHDPTLRLVVPTPDPLVDLWGGLCDPPCDRRPSGTPLGAPRIPALMQEAAFAEDRRLRHAGAVIARLALDNVRLYAEVRTQLEEVRASRQRIATAADMERQRLEQDLHDGAQQRLLCIGSMLGVLRRRLGSPADRDLVDELQRGMRAVIAELREVAQGLRPAILTDQGLAPTLAWLARRAGVRISLDVRLSERLDPVVEATAYYVVSEALQNVVKHTNDAHARVSAVYDAGELIIEVADNGPGGASVRSGTGLRGLVDRASAVGGHLAVDSPLGGGTVVRAELPGHARDRGR